ncbi:MAG TPA: HIT domain-containing protein [Anaerolineae bacterium]|nr:HIT domain-containing protein [Anaerolineae bacterium]
MTHDFYCDEVLKGRVPIQVVIETENVLAYHHTNPQWPVHIVVIPKYHVESLLSLSCENTELLSEMMFVLQKVIGKVLEEHEGCRLTTNFGNCQTTKHLHWHVYVADNMMS